MRSLFLIFNFLFICGLYAQFNAPLDKNSAPKSLLKSTTLSSEIFNFKVYGETWFSTVGDLVEIGEILATDEDNIFYLVPIFPDSTIITEYDTLTNMVYHAWIHGMAEIINPSMTPSQWIDESADIVIDSVMIPSLYSRKTNDSIVDTLFVDYIKHQSTLYILGDLNNSGEVDFGNFPHQRLYKSDPSTNRLDSGQIYRTDTILLTNEDTSGWPIIDVNDSIISTQRYGVYVRFQPGYEWGLDDTLENFNQFYLLVREQSIGESPRQIWPLYSGFCSYILPKVVRYNTDDWDFLFPGNIQLDEWPFEHLLILYKLTSNSLGENSASGNIQFKLFPNPAEGFLTINFTTNNTQSLEIILSDISGREVFRDEVYSVAKVQDFYTLNTSGFKPGFYSISFGGLSRKFVIK